MTNHGTLRVQRKSNIFNFAFLFLVRLTGRQPVTGKNDFPIGESFLNPVTEKSKIGDGEFPRLPPYKYHPGYWVHFTGLTSWIKAFILSKSVE